MKKILFPAITLLFSIFTFVSLASCSSDDDEPVVNVTGISLMGEGGKSISEITLTETETYQINVNVQPSDATNKEVTFKSDNEGVATVSKTGLVTAVGTGNTFITVASMDGKISTKLSITVALPPVKVTSVSLMGEGDVAISEIDLNEDGTYQINVNVQPDDATNKEVNFKSDNESVVTVSETGLITAVGSGNAIVTVTTADGNFTATLNVTVAVNPFARLIKDLTDEGRAAQSVDLGLPSGTLWADRNVGASEAGEYGNWFYWGTTYQPENNIFTENEYNSLMNISITVDIAHTSFDAATQRWGGDWQMPSQEQAKELIDECNWTRESTGYRVTSKTDETKSIFLPFTASCDHRGWVRNYNNHDWGCYWTSTAVGDNKVDYIYINQYGNIWINMGSYGPSVRYAGITIRPVMNCPK